jgi:hypothetical protein
MDAMADPIKTLASRFASLPCWLRVEIAKRLLMRQDDEQKRLAMQGEALSGQTEKSFIEQFWDEVAKSYDDDLQSRNPFTKERLRFGF